MSMRRVHNTISDYTVNSELYTKRLLNILRIGLLTVPPVLIYISSTGIRDKVISFLLWFAIFFMSIYNFKDRGRRHRDILEGIFSSWVLIILYFLDGNYYFLFTAIYNLIFFTYLIGTLNAVVMALLQCIAYIFGKALFTEIGPELLDRRLIGFIAMGVSSGLFGDIHRAFIQKNILLHDADVNTIRAFVEALEAKDEYTCGHSIRVSEYCRMIAMKINLSHNEVNNIVSAALLHDIGKISISDTILNKKGPLSDEEYNEIKKHPAIGVKILRNIKGISATLPLVLCHHERLDGKGYPNGLTKSEIPFGAKILSIADAYEAMTSDRSYRKSLGRDEAIRRLLAGKGTQFDPELTDAFIEALNGNTEAIELPEETESQTQTAKRRNFFDRLGINTLRKKVNYGVVIIIMLPFLIGLGYITSITNSTIKNLDNRVMDRQTAAMCKKIQEKSASLEKILTDYAVWDDTYSQVDLKDQQWFKDNIDGWLPENYGIDRILIIDNNEKLVHSYKCDDLDSDIYNFMNNVNISGAQKSGICILNNKPYIMSVSPIFKSDGSGPSKGAFMIAIEINDKYLSQMSSLEVLNINFKRGYELFKSDSSIHDMIGFNEAFEKAIPNGSHNDYYIGDYGSYTLSIIPEYDMATGKTAGYFIINYTDEAARHAERLVNYSYIIVAIMALVLAIGFITYLDNFIVSPVKKISNDINISVNTMTPLGGKYVNDEIKNIASGYNKLINIIRKM